MGSSVSSEKARTIRSEVFGRLACHNIFYWLFRDSGQNPLNRLCPESFLKAYIGNNIILSSFVILKYIKNIFETMTADGQLC